MALSHMDWPLHYQSHMKVKYTNRYSVLYWDWRGARSLHHSTFKINPSDVMLMILINDIDGTLAVNDASLPQYKEYSSYK